MSRRGRDPGSLRSRSDRAGRGRGPARAAAVARSGADVRTAGPEPHSPRSRMQRAPDLRPWLSREEKTGRGRGAPARERGRSRVEIRWPARGGPGGRGSARGWRPAGASRRARPLERSGGRGLPSGGPCVARTGSASRLARVGRLAGGAGSATARGVIGELDPPSPHRRCPGSVGDLAAAVGLAHARGGMAVAPGIVDTSWRSRVRPREDGRTGRSASVARRVAPERGRLRPLSERTARRSGFGRSSSVGRGCPGMARATGSGRGRRQRVQIRAQEGSP